ncbi:DUF4382 domain-containing protein [Halobellus captivus]|uniref:DUF4382 domain-containing protein n=1 Tax=Halobellus captivus TaxID=2592614 RepID=UPI0011A11C4F|nr:DUF4382 domain-containing protein [Halobellus captivus]
MNRNAIASLLVAALVLLAGCTGGMTGAEDGTAMDGTSDGASTAGSAEGTTGTVNLYISDEQNAIGDFEHLNVTITKVGLKPAEDDADEDDDADEENAEDDDADDSDETEDGDESTDDGGDTVDGDDADANQTTTDAEDDADDSVDDDDADEGEDADEEEDEGEDADDDDDREWVEYEVDNRTVDLTRLQGANATKLSELDVPNGSYEKVFVYVSDVNGTLKDGSDQRVKLPSGKLQLNSDFTVGNGESVDFVFDITVVKAGQSGKYILKPVISESGTDVEIERVDDDDDEDDEDDRDREDRAESALNATFLDDVAPGENATLRVTNNGSAIENATVDVDDGPSGTTDANGEFVVSIPDDADELEIEVSHGGAETELEFEFDESGDEVDDADDADE